MRLTTHLSVPPFSGLFGALTLVGLSLSGCASDVDETRQPDLYAGQPHTTTVDLEPSAQKSHLLHEAPNPRIVARLDARHGWELVSEEAIRPHQDTDDARCMDWCVNLDLCAQTCVSPEDLFAGPSEEESEGPDRLPGDDDCVVCGRETGFMGPPPELRAERVSPELVHLRWSTVDQADRYAVLGLRWTPPMMRPNGDWSADDLLVEGRLARLTLFVDTTEVQLMVEPVHHYSFMVVPLDADGRWLSEPSEPSAFSGQ